MIVKMKFITVTGPKDNLDYLIEKYLSKYEIQLENSLTELKNNTNLKLYLGTSPYKELFAKSEDLLHQIDSTGFKINEQAIRTYTFDQAVKVISNLEQMQEEYNKTEKELDNKLNQLNTYIQNLTPFKDFAYSIKDVYNFKYITYAFGKMPKEYYSKYIKYLDDTTNCIFVKCNENDTFIWGAYFAPVHEQDTIDSLFTSLHFERFAMPTEFDGNANEVYAQVYTQLQDYEKRNNEVNSLFSCHFKELSSELYLANEYLSRMCNNYDVRKMVACTAENQTDFFILCGWMPHNQARQFEKEIQDEPGIYVIENAKSTTTSSKPPTKLKNPAIIRPFEMFIEMYGLPCYTEMDPTLFVAITYAFIFGIMFGDVGQGLCLVIGGFLLYKFKHIRLAAIISGAGLFSTIFGFMFGSFFGFEDIIDAVWIRPGTAMMNLPFIGNMNTVLVVSIAFGMFLILITMIMHIINGIRAKKVEDILFNTNAMAGFIFYLALVIVIVLFMTGHTLPGGIALAVMFGIPLILIALKEPLTKLVERESKILPQQKGMFIVQSLFEMFEVLLSYMSNTISFVRIGAFAISHGAMMEVVLMLAGAESGNINWIVIILGNLLVCGMEGLIVGIQVLRLEYYEMFSRFYSGDGKAFKPFNSKIR